MSTLAAPRVAGLLALLLMALPARGDEGLVARLPGELSGSLGFEMRAFAGDPAFPGQEADNFSVSVFAEPEWYGEWDDGDQSILFTPFVRGDSDDGRRTHADIRELRYLFVGSGWELRAGIAKVFWGVTESIHLVDVINQDDAVEDVDGEDKLGQPMLQLTWLPDAGTLQLFVLPGFRERTFPGRRGRLRPSLVIDDDDVGYEANWGQGHVDFAGRWSMMFDQWDVGISHFYGTGRDPRFRVRVDGDAPVTAADATTRLRLAPLYDLVNQTGVDVQYTGDNALWKLEAIGRAGQGSYRAAAAAGVEYTFYAVLGTEGDLGVLSEFLYDSFAAPDVPSFAQLPPGGVPAAALRADPRLAIEAPPSPFEHDVFAGFRWTRNDVQSTELLAGAIVDVKDGSRFWTVEASRRLGDRFKLSLDVRWFDGFASDSFFHSIIDDDFVQLQIARYF